MLRRACWLRRCPHGFAGACRLGAQAADQHHRGLAPGGTADIAARIAAEAIQRQHGDSSWSRTRPASWATSRSKQVPIAARRLHVAIGIMGSLAVGAVVPGSHIPLDLDKELVPICNLVGVPMALIVRPNAPFKTIPELVAYAKANPGKVSYGSTGAGSTNQLGAELFAKEAGGLKLLHVPYRGGAPAIEDLAAGNRHVLRQHLGDRRPDQRRSGARAGARRVAAQADRARPAADDQGHSDTRHQQLVRHDGTGRPARGNRDSLGQALPRCDRRSAKQAAARLARPRLPFRRGPAFKAQITADRERWAAVVKQGKIKAE